MKTIICIFSFFFSIWCHAQKIEILILGTVHHFKDEYKFLQNFKKVQNDIASYNPDIICIEAIPINDTLSLKEIWPKNMLRADSLKKDLQNRNFDNIATEKQLQGAHLYSNYDFWNAYFLWDSLENSNSSPGPFSKYHRNLNNSEYGNIVFPAARKLGITKLQNIDYRYGENAFLENNNKVMKKLLFNLKLKLIRSYLKIQKKYKKANENGRLIEFVNEQEFQDSFSTLIDELPDKLPRSEEASSVKDSWHQRNRIMADRIYASAHSNNASRVLVTVGAAHVSHIKYYLEQLECRVTTYGELLHQQSNEH